MTQTSVAGCSQEKRHRSRRARGMRHWAERWHPLPRLGKPGHQLLLYSIKLQAGIWKAILVTRIVRRFVDIDPARTFSDWQHPLSVNTPSGDPELCVSDSNCIVWNISQSSSVTGYRSFQFSANIRRVNCSGTLQEHSPGYECRLQRLYASFSTLDRISTFLNTG